MPINKNAYIRYQTLDRCFRNRGKNFYIEDLVEHCNEALLYQNGMTNGVKKRQISNDIDFMESEKGWSIPLERIREGRRVYYRYSDLNFSIQNSIITDKELSQLQSIVTQLSCFQGLPNFVWIEEIINKLETVLKSKGNYYPIVGFSQNYYLKGLEHFIPLFEAIQNKQPLRIEYKSFKTKQDSVVVIHPYFLKEYNQRWFLFGLNNELKTISNMPLDRIQKVVNTNVLFVENELIDFEEYFDDVVGVTVFRDKNPEKILLKIKNERWPYIESKPIHGSQTIKENSDEYVLVQITVQINYELIALILSFGCDITVISPLSLQNTIIENINQSKQNYFYLCK